MLVPDHRLETRHARTLLPSQVPHADAARTAGRAALLVHALTADPALLLPATEDWLHQRPRPAAMPETLALVDQLRSQGRPAVVSGAGRRARAVRRCRGRWARAGGRPAGRATAQRLAAIAPGIALPGHARRRTPLGRAAAPARELAPVRLAGNGGRGIAGRIVGSGSPGARTVLD